MATGFQPVSWGWIGLDAEARRDDTPIHQVIKSISQRAKKLQDGFISPSTCQANSVFSPETGSRQIRVFPVDSSTAEQVSGIMIRRVSIAIERNCILQREFDK